MVCYYDYSNTIHKKKYICITCDEIIISKKNATTKKYTVSHSVLLSSMFVPLTI